MNDNSLDFIIEAEKMRKITLEHLKKEAVEKSETERKLKERENEHKKTFSTVEYLLEPRGQK